MLTPVDADERGERPPIQQCTIFYLSTQRSIFKIISLITHMRNIERPSSLEKNSLRM